MATKRRPEALAEVGSIMDRAPATSLSSFLSVSEKAAECPALCLPAGRQGR